jgi:endonuclease III
VPAFRILTNKTLDALAERRPRTQSELLAVPGVGPKLLQTHGAALLGLCAGKGGATGR